MAVEAWAYDKRTAKKIRKTFTGTGALAEAKGWRADATGAVRRGTMRAPTQVTLREAAEAWLQGAKSGGVRKLAAKMLGVTFRSFRYRLAKHALAPDGPEGDDE